MSLTAGNWDRVARLFEEALAIPADQRASWLACGSDREARVELDAMLKASDADRELHIESRLRLASAEHAKDSPDLPEGTRIGPYHIDALVGEGGMGEVYRARRVEGEYRQTVALKVLRSEVRSRDLVRRFERERQILATLEHPNIAPILDGGRTPDGRPYLVMQYVDGIPITVFCERRQLPLAERLRLFCQVADAVQFAHARLVVHRDLKPSNILVDNSARVRLLDFGIAKVLADPDNDDEGERTLSTMRLLTPRYAAPEQLSGDPITLATDVYSLGVLLFEMITGDPPDDVPLSAAAGPNARTLSGDLGRIVMMALRREPERRYATVLQFATDVRRYLAGLPVSARPDSWLYRTGKFVSRHTAAVTVGVGLILLLVGFTVATRVQSERVIAERDRAQKLAGFLTQIFELSEPDAMRGQTVTMREMLDSTSRRAERELADDATTRVEVLEALARAYHGLGFYDRSRDLLLTSLTVRQQIRRSEKDDAAIANTLDELAEKQRDLSDFSSSLQNARAALEIRERLHGGRDARTIHSMNTVAATLRSSGDVNAAAAMFERALASARASIGENNREVADALLGLAQCHIARGEHEAAERAARQSLTLHARLSGAGTTATIRARSTLAQVLISMGRFGDAEPLVRQDLDYIKLLLGESHPTYAFRLMVLGEVLDGKGDTREAEQVLRLSSNLISVAVPRDPRREARINATLGRVLLGNGHRDEGQRILRRALAAAESISPPPAGLIDDIRRAMRGTGR
jgi:eukaryotic-like serine/threonine-protein kinase